MENSETPIILTGTPGPPPAGVPEKLVEILDDPASRPILNEMRIRDAQIFDNEPALRPTLTDIRRRDADHRRHVTYALVALLAALVLGYPACVLLMEWYGKKYEGLATAVNSCLPVVSGLVGSAIAYYFSRDDKSK